MTRIKRITHWQKVVDNIIADYRRLDNACDAALKAGAMDAEGPLHDTIWRSFENMLDYIDTYNWIKWFIYDNEFGKKELKAAGCGKRGQTPIKTTRHLARLIVESEEYHQSTAP